MRGRSGAVLAACVVVIAAGLTECGGEEELTELVVIVHSDLDFPNEADRIVVVAEDGTGTGATFEREKAITDGTATLPLTLLPAHRGLVLHALS